jgi:hypothetical protein
MPVRRPRSNNVIAGPLSRQSAGTGDRDGAGHDVEKPVFLAVPVTMKTL